MFVVTGVLGGGNVRLKAKNLTTDINIGMDRSCRNFGSEEFCQGSAYIELRRSFWDVVWQRPHSLNLQ